MTDASRDSALRRSRSAGDIPVYSSPIRSPDPVHPRNSDSHVRGTDPGPSHDASRHPSMARSRTSAGLVLDRARAPAAAAIPEDLEVPEDSEAPIELPRLVIPNPTPPSPPAPPAFPRHNVSLYSQIMTFFGYGRGASRERKLLVSLWYNLAWGFVQAVVIVTMLAIASHTESKTMPGRNEWVACDRPLGAWACIYVFRIAFSAGLTYWGWLRDSKAHANGDDPENATERPSRNVAPTPVALAHPPPIGTGSPSDAGPSEGQPPSQHNVLNSRLTILSSLITLSWFLTAHILQYTSLHTCRFSSPHIWWLTFGILCIMYLVVLEVIILGFIVFLVAPIIFLVWNIFLMCLGRHPMQNPTMIRPDIGKLSASVVDRIPLVVYIPPPPDAPPGSIQIPEAVYSYPPKPPQSVKPKRRFRFIRRRGTKEAAAEVPERTPLEAGGKPQTWEDHWEHTGYPFVMLEGNRAACAICLMDFEEPKRIAGDDLTTAASTTGLAPSSSTLAVEEVSEEVSAQGTEAGLKLEDAGEGAQPLRLLACGHVFHKTCLDPWLIDVSGRCPVCQRAVELPPPSKGK